MLAVQEWADEASAQEWSWQTQLNTTPRIGNVSEHAATTRTLIFAAANDQERIAWHSLVQQRTRSRYRQTGLCNLTVSIKRPDDCWVQQHHTLLRNHVRWGAH